MNPSNPGMPGGQPGSMAPGQQQVCVCVLGRGGGVMDGWVLHVCMHICVCV